MRRTILFLLVIFSFHKQFSQNGLCFTPAPNSPLIIDLISSFSKADFNNDNQIDFLALGQSTYFSLIMSNGTGGYLPPTSFSFTAFLSSIESNDFNNDGKQDVAISFPIYNNIEILLGNGTGSFVPVNTYSVGTTPTSILSKDLNNDSKQDLIVCNSSSSNISVLIGNGNGSFSSPVHYFVSANPHDVVSGDFNNDSKIDLAIAADSLTILKGNGNGTFSKINTINFGFGFFGNVGSSVLKSVDYNNDGKLDIAGIYGDTLYCAKGNGNFTFGILNKYKVGSGASSIDFSDFNNDGKIDFVTSNYFSQDYTILLGNGIGSFTNIVTYSISATLPTFKPQVLIAADVNNDNKQDIIIGHDNCADITILLNCNTVDVGINENNKSIFSAELYPNPANDILNIEIQDEASTSSTTNYQIINNLGQIIRTEELVFKNKDASINTANLPNGVYLLKLLDGVYTEQSRSARSDNSVSISKRFVISR
jgi:hypothetical protein